MTAPTIPKSLVDYPVIEDWLHFEGDDRVRLRSGKVEIGQGVATALVQIAADELDIAPERFDLVAGDTRESPDEGFTAGSMSVQHSGKSIQLAASAARQLLLQEAAKLLQADRGDLAVEDGTVNVNGRTSDLTYWSLAKEVGLSQQVMDYAKPKLLSERKLIGTSFQRTDLPAKVTGKPVFLHDLELDGMLHGRIVHPPNYTTPLVELDEETIKSDPDVLLLVRDGSFIGIIAEREDAALRAVKRLGARAKWGPPTDVPADPVAFLESVVGEEEVVHLSGDPEKLEGRRFSTTVSRPYLAHGSIGPACAIAEWQGDHVTVHTHSQGVYQLREGLAMALDMPEENISVVHVQGAGCYGHNGTDDAAFDAVLLARAVPGRPVRVVWSRSSELGVSPLGPAMVTKAQAVLDDDNRIIGFTTDAKSQIHGSRPGRGSPNLLAAEYMAEPKPSSWRTDVPPNIGGGADRNAKPGYAIPNIRASKWIVHDLAYRASSLRALGAFVNVFAIETLMDDIALEIGEDPLSYRLSHLDDDRGRAVLERVAKAAGWPGSQEDGAGLGIAYARYKNTSCYCAIVAHIELDEDIKVTHVWTAVDAGLVINPDGISNQIEGGIIQAASWTLKEAVQFEDGIVTSRDWETYPILRFDEVPEVSVEIISRPDQPILGVGECAQGPTAAAIGNAIHTALGVRVRKLPLTRDAIISALG
jgi:nicotinate dehydrogenase subunit B